MFFSRVTGKVGEIRIVELGAVIGQLARWDLVREMKDDKPTGLYTFRGELSYVNKALFSDRDYEPTVIVTTGRDRQTKKPRQYRLEQEQGRKRTLTGRSLLMEGVRVCQ